MIKSSGNGKQFIKTLVRNKEDFEVRRTTNSTMVIHDEAKYFFSIEDIPKKFLYLYGEIKREVERNIKSKNLKVPPRQKANYFQVFNMETMGLGEFYEFENVVEVDINKAYYYSLFILGYISEAFFNKCLTLPKKVRLSLCGSIATQKFVDYYYNGEKKEDESHIVKNDDLRNVFFHCVSYTDEALSVFKEMSQKHFIFYWVDGIYLKQYKELEYHKRIIESQYKMQFSMENIDKLVALKSEDNCNLIAIKKEGDENIKTFNFPSILKNLKIKN